MRDVQSLQLVKHAAIYLLLGIQLSGVVSTAKIPVLIDADPAAFVQFGADVDDDLALLFSLLTPQFDILGITITFGNAPLNDTWNDAKLLFGSFTLDKLPPLYSGASYWSNRTNPTDASNFIVNTLIQQPNHAVTLISLGPLTNIAQALCQNPSIEEKLSRVIIMGGAVKNQFRIDPDLNFLLDRTAAKLVLATNIPKLLIPIQTCLEITISSQDIEDWSNRCCPSSRAFCSFRSLLRDWAQQAAWLMDLWFPKSMFPQRPDTVGFIPWDLVAVTFASNPELFQQQTTYQISLGGLSCETQSLDSSCFAVGHPGCVTVPSGVDRVAWTRLVANTLCSDGVHISESHRWPLIVGYQAFLIKFVGLTLALLSLLLVWRLVCIGQKRPTPANRLPRQKR